MWSSDLMTKTGLGDYIAKPYLYNFMTDIDARIISIVFHKIKIYTCGFLTETVVLDFITKTYRFKA